MENNSAKGTILILTPIHQAFIVQSDMNQTCYDMCQVFLLASEHLVLLLPFCTSIPSSQTHLRDRYSDLFKSMARSYPHPQYMTIPAEQDSLERA